MRKITDLDPSQVTRQSYSVEDQAQRVVIVGGGEVKLEVDPTSMINAVKEGLKNLKIEAPIMPEIIIPEQKQQDIQIKVIEIEKPVVIIQKEVQTIEVPKILEKLHVMKIEVPVIHTETKIIEIEKPIIQTKDKIPAFCHAIMVAQAIGIIILLFTRS